MKIFHFKESKVMDMVESYRLRMESASEGSLRSGEFLNCTCLDASEFLMKGLARWNFIVERKESKRYG